VAILCRRVCRAVRDVVLEVRCSVCRSVSIVSCFVSCIVPCIVSCILCLVLCFSMFVVRCVTCSMRRSVLTRLSKQIILNLQKICLSACRSVWSLAVFEYTSSVCPAESVVLYYVQRDCGAAAHRWLTQHLHRARAHRTTPRAFAPNFRARPAGPTAATSARHLPRHTFSKSTLYSAF
jgi:hypothetical protein